MEGRQASRSADGLGGSSSGSGFADAVEAHEKEQLQANAEAAEEESEEKAGDQMEIDICPWTMIPFVSPPMQELL